MHGIAAGLLVLLAGSCFAEATSLPAGDFPPNPIEKEGWDLTFHDEFDGPNLDTGKWITGYLPGRFGGDYEHPRKPTFYEFRKDHGANVIVLQIPKGSGTTSALSTYNCPNWHRGWRNMKIPVRETFTQLLGYYEVRSRHPVALTALHAAWWQVQAREQGGELDVYEDNRYAAPGSHIRPYKVIKRENYPYGKHTADYYHVYGMEICETGVRWYFDNKLIAEYALDWSPHGRTPFGHIFSMYRSRRHVDITHEYMIDYFRAYRRREKDVPYHRLKVWGSDVTGGLAGKVIRVTNLNADGPGSLRAACEAEGPRLVVFEVGGVIDLGGKGAVLRIANPHITIAGQTAPEPGVTLVRGGVEIATEHVVVQHIAVRVGPLSQSGVKSPQGDCISTAEGAKNVVIDHCSGTWSCDESMTLCGDNILLYRCLNAEGLKDRSGGSVCRARNAAYIGNLWAHFDKQHPLGDSGSRFILVNNVIYNSGSHCVSLSPTGKPGARGTWPGKERPAEASVVNNLWMTGGNTGRDPFIILHGDRLQKPPPKVHLSGNVLKKQDWSDAEAVKDTRIAVVPAPPVWPEGYQAPALKTQLRRILQSAGAHAKYRDPIDRRIVNEVLARTGGIVAHPKERENLPAYAMQKRPTPHEVPEGPAERRAWLDTLASSVDTDDAIDKAALDRLVRHVETGLPTTEPWRANLLAGKRVAADKETEKAGVVVDGRLDKNWSVQGRYPHRLEFDLGTTYRIHKVEIFPDGRRPYRFKVLAKAENEQGAYGMVCDASGNVKGGAVLERTFQPARARFVRIEITGPADIKRCSLKEVAVYGCKAHGNR